MIEFVSKILVDSLYCFAFDFWVDYVNTLTPFEFVILFRDRFDYVNSLYCFVIDFGYDLVFTPLLMLS